MDTPTLRLPETLPRILALGIWPKLKRQQWMSDTSYRKLSDYGASPGFATVSSGKVPKAKAMNDTIANSTPHGIGCYLMRDDHPALPCDLAATLTIVSYNAVVLNLDAASAADWDLALEDPYTPAPFRYHTDGNGHRHLIRASDPAISDRLLLVLAELVNRCELYRVNQGQPIRWQAQPLPEGAS